MTDWSKVRSIVAKEDGCEITEEQEDGTLGAPTFLGQDLIRPRIPAYQMDRRPTFARHAPRYNRRVMIHVNGALAYDNEFANEEEAKSFVTAFNNYLNGE